MRSPGGAALDDTVVCSVCELSEVPSFCRLGTALPRRGGRAIAAPAGPGPAGSRVLGRRPWRFRRRKGPVRTPPQPRRRVPLQNGVQGRQFGKRERAELPPAEFAKLNRPKGNTLQTHHLMTDPRKQSSHFPVLAFGQDHFDVAALPLLFENPRGMHAEQSRSARRQEVDDPRPTRRIAMRTDDSARLVHGEILLALHAQGLAVQGHLFAGRIDRCAQLIHHPAVHRHATIDDELLAGPARTKTARRQILLEPNADRRRGGVGGRHGPGACSETGASI
jgi:hypothetical protein